MKYFFILGRNPLLSRAEIFSYFQARKIEIAEIFFEENILIIDSKQELTYDIQEFGGLLYSGKISFEGDKKDLEEKLQEIEIIPSDKFTYAVMGQGPLELLKEKFKKEKKKAMQKQGRRQITFQDGSKDNLAKAEYIIFLHEEKENVYFGIADQIYDFHEVEKRDMKKPTRRESLAISPRLSKILINLSGAKEKSLLLDPFCGVGGIIQEALLKHISAYGIDIDVKAVEDCKKNLSWLKKEYILSQKYTIEQKNALRAPNKMFDAVATETPLGKLVTKKLQKKEAQNLIFDFEHRLIPILKRLREVKKGNAKIAITFPKIRDIRVNLDKIVKNTGLRVIEGPIEESREGQFIARDIIVFN